MIKTTSKKRAAARRHDALSLLTQDHKKVSDLFKRYERAPQPGKRDILHDICASLSAHAQLEEELFYPALRRTLGDNGADLLDEATVEHTSIKALVSELEGAEPGDELVDAKVKVLSEYVKHHVREEEDELFPKTKKAKGLDLTALGARMEQRKGELEAAAGVTPVSGNGRVTANGRAPADGAKGRRRVAVAARR